MIGGFVKLLNAQDVPENEEKKELTEKKKEETKGNKLVLEKEVVSSSRIDQTPFQSPLALTIVEKKEIVEKAGRTPAEILMYKPGIWIQKTGHQGGAPVLRGFMGNQVVYLFDGIRRNTAGIFGGPNGFLQTIDALDVDKIEVVRGPGSVLYGSDAIGGVINVISNEEPIFTDKWSFGGRSYAQFRSADQEKSGRQEIHVSNKKFFLFGGITSRDIDDLEGGHGVSIQTPSGSREFNWDLQTDYLIAPDHVIEAFAQSYDRPSGSRFDRPTQKSNANREMYGLRYFGKEIGFINELQTTTYYHNQESLTDSPNFDSASKESTIGFEVQAKSTIKDTVNLVYGIHYHQDNIDASDPQNGTEETNVKWQNPALFVLSEYQVTDRLKIDLGLRWDQFSLKSHAPDVSDLDQTVQDAIASGAFALKDLNLDASANALTGGLGATFGITEHINLVAHIGKAFRAPNKSDELEFGQFTFGFNVPTTNIKPESSWTYEIGTKAQYESFSAGFNTYYTVVQDGIISEPGTFNGLTYIDVNGNGVEDSDERVYRKSNSKDKIVAYGVEFESNWYIPTNWTEAIFRDNFLSVYTNFSVAQGKNKGTNEPLDRGFPLNGLFGLRIENDRDAQKRVWWVSVETWLVSDFHKIPSGRFNADPAFLNNPQDSKSGLIRPDGMPGFGIINLHGGVKVYEGSTVTFGVENIYDKNYRMKDSRMDAPGINFILGLEVIF